MNDTGANQQVIQEAKKELQEEQKRNIEIHEKKKKKKDRSQPKDKSKKRSKKIKKKSTKDKHKKHKKKSSRHKKKRYRRYSSESESSPSLSKVLRKKVSRSNFTQIMHKIDDATMKEMDQVRDINTLTNYNNMGGVAEDPNAQSEFDNIDPFTFVKLDHNASKYWDERSAPLDNVQEINILNLNKIHEPSLTYLLEIITPCLPTRFYEKMPDRILKNFQFSGRNKNISSLVSAWKKDDLSTMNNDKEFDNRMRKNQLARPEDAAKWYSKTLTTNTQMTNETFGEAFSNYAADLEKNIGSRGLPANYRGIFILYILTIRNPWKRIQSKFEDSCTTTWSNKLQQKLAK